MKTEFKLVLLSLILIKDQVRTIFEKEPLDELTDSIRENGVLQPIVLNQVKGKLYLVCGERRFRASVKVAASDKKRNTIPAVIHQNLTDDQVLQMQIIENLQRKDVHPMEEAVAFKSMMESKGLEIKEVAAKVGKTPMYVAARLKLNSLIQEWQKLFFKRRIDLKTAIAVSKISEESQKDLWENEAEDNENEIEIDEWTLSNYKADLTRASFDLKDKDLHKNGACSKCVHNTAFNTTLFPEEAKKAKCMLPSCFAEKTEVNFQRALEEATADPTTLLYNPEWSGSSSEVKQIEADHGKVYQAREVLELNPPEEVDETEFNVSDYSNKKERDTAYDKAVKSYNQELKEFEKEKQSGRKALRIAGPQKGSYCWVEIKKSDSRSSSSSGEKVTAKGFAEKTESGKLTASDIDAEITRIKSGEERKQEIEDQKITGFIHKMLDSDKKFFMNDGRLSRKEELGLIIALYDRVQHYSFDDEEMEIFSDMFQSKFKMDVDTGDKEFCEFLSKQSDEAIGKMLNLLTRAFILNSLHANFLNFTKDAKSVALAEIAHEFNGDSVNEIIIRETPARKKRTDAVAKSIDKLNEKKEALISGTKKKK